MAKHTFPNAPEMWKRYVDMYIEIFAIAIELLAKSSCDKCDEPTISLALCPILSDVCFKESKNRNYNIPTPNWENPIQPIRGDDLNEGRIGKRPDFTCTLTNHMATSIDKFEISLHVECKRLGMPTSTTWLLNENYVTNGIMRFDSIEHGYGNRAFSGLMIGYIVSMTPECILKEVNSYQKKHCKENPAIKYIEKRSNVQFYEQILRRRNLKPSVFHLAHLWVEMQK